MGLQVHGRLEEEHGRTHCIYTQKSLRHFIYLFSSTVKEPTALYKLNKTPATVLLRGPHDGLVCFCFTPYKASMLPGLASNHGFLSF